MVRGGDASVGLVAPFDTGKLLEGLRFLSGMEPQRHLGWRSGWRRISGSAILPIERLAAAGVKAVLSSGGILQTIRVKIFGENQTRFGKRLGLKKGTILRLEGHREGQRPKSRHLSLLRLLRAPNDKAELLEALLKQMEVAIEEEQRAEEALQREGLGSLSGPSEGQNGNDSPLPLAERLEQVAQRAEDAIKHAEQARLADEARRAQEARRQEEATHEAEAEAALRAQEVQLLEERAQRTEQAAQRAEQLCREVEAGRAEDAREREEAARRVEQAAQRAEQLCREVEAGRVEDAREREEAARRVEQASQRAEQLCREVEAGRATDAREREEAAKRVEQAFQRAEQLCREVEAGRAAEAREREEASRWVEQSAQRIEQRFRELVEAAHAEVLRKWEEAAQRAEQATQRVEQLLREEENRRAVEAQKLEEVAKLRVAERRRMLRLAFATLAACAVFSAPRRSAVEAVDVALPRVGPGDAAQVELQDAKPHVPSSENRNVVAEDSGALLSSGLDGGTELTSLVSQVLPFPKGALPQQLAAPCPASMEEINGLCWLKVQLTPAQVKDGACDTAGLYEPSDGWCRTHHAGYRPLRATLRKNNSVDPQ